MFFTERLRILQTVEKLEIDPFSLLQEILRSTLIFGEPAHSFQLKIQVLIRQIKNHGGFSPAAPKYFSYVEFQF
jgi:hypothetical protein